MPSEIAKLIGLVEKLSQELAEVRATVARLEERQSPATTATEEALERKRARDRKRIAAKRAVERQERQSLATLATISLPTPLSPTVNLSELSSSLPSSKPLPSVTTAAREAELFAGAAWPVAIAPAKKPKERKVGCRVPEDWMPEPTDNDIGYDLGMTEDQIGKEHDKFMDYWRAKAGAGGVKLDWNATFRNWLRKASDAYKEIPTRQQSNSNGHYRQR